MPKKVSSTSSAKQKIEEISIVLTDKNGDEFKSSIGGLSKIKPELLAENFLLFSNHVSMMAWMSHYQVSGGFEKLNKDEKALITTMFNGGKKNINKLIKGKKVANKKMGGKNGK